MELYIPTQSPPIFPAPKIYPVAGQSYDTLSADPRLVFLGAPSSYMEGFTAQLLKATQATAKTHLQNYSKRFIPDGFIGVKKVETVTLPDGTVYTLTDYWTRVPEVTCTTSSATQTEENAAPLEKEE